MTEVEEFSDVICERSAYTPLTSPWKELAEIQTGETEAKVRTTLALLRQMIKNHGKLRCPLTDDFLLRFLRFRHFDCEAAYRHIRNFCRMGSEFSTLENADIPSLLMKVSGNMPMLIEKRMDSGRKILIMKTASLDPEEMFAVFCVTVEYLCRDQLTQALGMEFIIDYTGFDTGHTKHAAPTLIQKHIRMTKNCLPIMFNHIHIINTPFLFDVLYGVCSRLLPTEIQNKLIFHGKNLHSLHHYIPKSHLPQEYGGTEGTFNPTPFLIKMIEQHQSLIDTILEIGYVKDEKE